MSGTLKVGGKTLATHDTNTNVSTLTADEANVGSNALVVNSSGNVGVGANPSQKLDLVGGAFIPTYMRVSNLYGSGIIGMGGANQFEIAATSTNPIVFYTSTTERMRIDSSGNIIISQDPGRYTIDTANSSISVANGGTVDFSAASGMLLVNHYTNGHVTLWLCGGGNTVAVASAGTQVGSLAFNSGISGYTWTNNSGSTATFGFQFFRTRYSA